MSDLGTVQQGGLKRGFTGTRNHPKTAYAIPLAPSPASRHYNSPQVFFAWTGWYPCSDYPDPDPLEQSLVECRNINLLSIRHSRLRYALGPTNPRLMTIVEEP